MFKDHMMDWLTNSIGEAKLDHRFMAQPHRIGTRNFDSGISHYSQWSGKGHRDLEHHIIPVIAGADGSQPGVMKAMRALMDFIYIAQYPLQSDMTLDALKLALSNFHKNKEIFIQNGSRTGSAGVIDHMNIPKVHALHQWMTNIPDLGTTNNYCTEIGETLHIEYIEQIIRYLIRLESLHLYRGYLRGQWYKSPASI
ncbi:hypothetical protein BS47DRAFT_1372641 [Hydnum rufescens UP504]|uniref:Uncharacterized protein n=1 Tax=Hydnum rufescens UP504 TaxID=1448309 RepID=A0A9P6DTB2_9AGAM|nr:hypothetical protein BS47DRAFT_1372641 [Hydnum rufescens UP504]